jgi:SAM-dependent methyltransferase
MSELNIERTHDKNIYLQEDRYAQPKEYFKAIAKLMRDSEVVKPGSRVVDLGCAAGEFLYYLAEQFPQAECHGYDVVGELLEKGREKVPGVTFKSGSVLDEALLEADSVDVALLLGVHQIFDDFETCIGNLLSWTRKGGRIYVIGLFNSFPIDVWVKYRLVDDPDPLHREPGWNIFAKESVSRFLNERGVRFSFSPFEMPFDLPPNEDDPVRTWTFLAGDGQRLLTNGLSLLCNQEILEIEC